MLTFRQTAYHEGTRANQVELMHVDFPPGPVFNIHRLTTTGDLTLINRMGLGALRIGLFNLRF
jgi:hypothetical protein